MVPRSTSERRAGYREVRVRVTTSVSWPRTWPPLVYPSPTRLVSLFMYVIHNKTKHLIVRVGGMVKKQEGFYPIQIFFSLKTQNLSIISPCFDWKWKWLSTQDIWKFLYEQIYIACRKSLESDSRCPWGRPWTVFDPHIYSVSARRTTTRLIDSPTARGSYRMPYK